MLLIELSAEGEDCEPLFKPPLFSGSWQSANVFL